MKKNVLSILFVLLSFFLFSTHSDTFQNKLKIQDSKDSLGLELTEPILDMNVAEKILKESRNHRDRGEFRKSLDLAIKAIAIQEEAIPDSVNILVPSYLYFVEINLSINDFDTCNKYLVKAQNLLDVHLKKESILQADLSFIKGIYFDMLSDKKNAETNFQDALSGYKKNYGRLNDRTAASLHNLGYFYATIGEFDKSLNYYQEALEIREEVLPENDHNIGMTYHNMGIVYYSKYNFEKALKYTAKGLAIREISLGEDHPLTADSYMNLGLHKSKIEIIKEVLPYYRKALGIYIKAYGEKHSRVAEAYQRIGFVYLDSGDIKNGELNINKALQINKSIYPDNHLQIGINYYNLGNSYLDFGFADKAILYFKKSISIFKSSLGEEHDYVANSLGNLGSAYILKSDYESALIYVINGIKVKEKLQGDYELSLSDSYQNLGLIYFKKKKYARAKHYFIKSIDILRDRYSERHISLASPKFNLAMLQSELGDTDSAIRNIEQVIELRLKNVPINIIDLSNYYLELSTLYKSKGDFNSAIIFNQKGLELSDKIGTPSIILGKLLTQKADLYLSKSVEESRDLYRLSLMNYYELKTDSDKADYWSNLISLLDKSIEGYLNTYSNLNQLRNKDIIEIFARVEESRGVLLKGAIAQTSILVGDTLQSMLLSEFEAKREALSTLEKRKFEEVEKSDLEEDGILVSSFENEIFDAYQNLDSIQLIIKSKFPDYYNARISNKVIDTDKFRTETLEKNQIFIEYFVGDLSIYVFVIAKNTLKIKKIKKDFPLSQLIQQMRSGIYQPFLDDKLNQYQKDSLNNLYIIASQKLYHKLIEPIEETLENASSLVIVPDGVLGYIPFDALLTVAVKDVKNYRNYPYLIRKYQTSISYSATLLQQMKEKKHKCEPKKKFLAVAPLFDTSGRDTILLASRFIDFSKNRNSLGPLHYNIPEAKSIQEIIGGDLLTGNKATEEAFTNIAGDYRILHLSTHGKANDTAGDYSFLAFYELKDSIENEWLYNRELYELDLNADMVVLSACETGIGQLQKGEGIISLARGFSYAGAKSIITSLWGVNDKQTPELMNKFYQNLYEGDTKDVALRKAKLEYIKTNPNPEPFFWAAFIPIGDMSPIDFGQGLPIWTLLLFSFLIFGFLAYFFFNKKL